MPRLSLALLQVPPVAALPQGVPIPNGDPDLVMPNGDEDEPVANLVLNPMSGEVLKYIPSEPDKEKWNMGSANEFG